MKTVLDEIISGQIQDEKGLDTEIVEANDYSTELTERRYAIEFSIKQSAVVNIKKQVRNVQTDPPNDSASNQAISNTPTNRVHLSLSVNNLNQQQTLLKTAIITISTQNKRTTAHTLLDEGARHFFIT